MKKRRMGSLFLALLLLLSVGFTPTALAAPTPVTSLAGLPQVGGVYTLTEDIIITASGFFNTSGAVIDGKGYTIYVATTDSVDRGLTISTDVTLKNVTLDFSNSPANKRWFIKFESSANPLGAVFENVKVANAVANGASGVAIDINGANVPGYNIDVTLKNVTLENCKTSSAYFGLIQIKDVTGVTIDGLTADTTKVPGGQERVIFVQSGNNSANNQINVSNLNVTSNSAVIQMDAGVKNKGTVTATHCEYELTAVLASPTGATSKVLVNASSPEQAFNTILSGLAAANAPYELTVRDTSTNIFYVWENITATHPLVSDMWDSAQIPSGAVVRYFNPAGPISTLPTTSKNLTIVASTAYGGDISSPVLFTGTAQDIVSSLGTGVLTLKNFNFSLIGTYRAFKGNVLKAARGLILADEDENAFDVEKTVEPLVVDDSKVGTDYDTTPFVNASSGGITPTFVSYYGAGGVAPTIEEVTVTLVSASQVKVRVQARGAANLLYQWQSLQEGGGWADIPSASGSVMTLRNIKGAANKTFRVVVRDPGGGGYAVSEGVKPTKK